MTKDRWTNNSDCLQCYQLLQLHFVRRLFMKMTIISNKTRLRGNDQRDGRPPLYTTDANLLWQYAKIFVTMTTGVDWGFRLNDTITLPDP